MKENFGRRLFLKFMAGVAGGLVLLGVSILRINTAYAETSIDWRGDGTSHTYITSEQIIDLAQKGFEIASHTINHPNLIRLRADNFGEYLQEISTSRNQLEELTQEPVTSFAYPNGVFDQAVIQDVAQIYDTAVSTISSRIQSQSRLYQLLRTRIT